MPFLLPVREGAVGNRNQNVLLRPTDVAVGVEEIVARYLELACAVTEGGVIVQAAATRTTTEPLQA